MFSCRCWKPRWDWSIVLAWFCGQLYFPVWSTDLWVIPNTQHYLCAWSGLICSSYSNYVIFSSFQVCLKSVVSDKWEDRKYAFQCVCVGMTRFPIFCCLSDRIWYTMSDGPAYTIRTFKSCFSHHHLHLEMCLPSVTQPHTYIYVSHTVDKLFVMSQHNNCFKLNCMRVCLCLCVKLRFLLH